MNGQRDTGGENHKTRAPGRSRGFAQAGSVLAARLARAGEGRGFAEFRVLTHWAEIAGEALAPATRPISLRFAKGAFGGTLTLFATAALGPEIQMQLPALRDRVNAFYGYRAVERIGLTQTAPDGFAEDRPKFSAPPKARPLGPETIARLDKVNDPALKAALTRLAEQRDNRAPRGPTTTKDRQ
jgi:hypothetical protein